MNPPSFFRAVPVVLLASFCLQILSMAKEQNALANVRATRGEVNWTGSDGATRQALVGTTIGASDIIETGK